MSQNTRLKDLFKRTRRPGDLVFALLFFILSISLLSQLGDQSPWNGTRNLFSQPAFWPTVSLVAMTLFAGLHLITSAMSQRIEGRWSEVWQWVRSAEYAGWFLLYVAAVPALGYLPASIIAAGLLGLRVGYRTRGKLVSLIVSAVVIVVVFRGFLQVKIPPGALYDHLPDSIRLFMLSYL